MATDVVVVGAGIAGLTAAIMLARTGLRVVCVDPVPPPRARVGESLDWAAPALLERVGLPLHRLVGERMGTWKREVHGVSTSGPRMVGRPRRWMSRWPLRSRLETVHVDRARFDVALCELASAAGVRFLWDAAARVDVDGDRVVGCRTRSGDGLTARWFLDASGRARLFARALGIQRLEYGPARTAIWAQREAPQAIEGTVLHLDDGPGELRWAWEIPLTSNRQSIGVVIPEAEFRGRRRRVPDSAEILEDVIAGFPGMTQPGPGDVHRVHVRGLRCYTHERVSGSNWLMIGEAASLADPLTSTGVSAAMRHGIEAAEIIQSDLPGRMDRALRRFDRRLRSVANLYNEAIEELLYAPGLRHRVGIRWAARAYVILGYGMSVLYARIGGTGMVRHAAVVGIAGAYRLWLGGWRRLAGARHDSGLHRRDRPASDTLDATGGGRR